MLNLPDVGWYWRKLWAPPELMRKKGNLITITTIRLAEPETAGDITRHKTHPLVLITGDGSCLPKDVEVFESWKLPHDLYCVNRSLLFFERQVDHWAAIDIEESGWFAENVNFKVEDHKHIVRHTIGSASFAYDVYWDTSQEKPDALQRRVFVGNTGYFAILTALEMGYERIVLAGMPLNMERCWYEPEEAEGPNWMGWMYVQWMDFKIKAPEKAAKVRSLSGYSEFLLGTATKEWALNGA